MTPFCRNADFPLRSCAYKRAPSSFGARSNVIQKNCIYFSLKRNICNCVSLITKLAVFSRWNAQTMQIRPGK